MENNEKKKKNKKKLPLVITIAVAIIIILLLGILVKVTDGGDDVPTVAETDTTIAVDTRSLLLKTGETGKISIQESDVTFESNNTAVATVTEDGTVTAVGSGMALITITQGDKTGYCGVIVDSIGELTDISSKNPSLLFNQMELYEKVEVAGMAVDATDNAIYFSQNYGVKGHTPLNADLIVTKVGLIDNTWTKGSYMRFYLSGEGHFDVKDGTVWMESSGSGYGKTISCVQWEDEGFVQDAFGKTYDIGELNGTRLTVDSKNNMVAVYDSEHKQYLIYDSSVLTEDASNPYIHAVVCASNQEPVRGVDDSRGNYNASVAGFALADGYIYQFGGSKTQMFVSVFDLSGQLQYCEKLEIETDIEDCTPVAIAVENGEVYVCMQSGDSSCYYANVWKY